MKKWAFLLLCIFASMYICYISGMEKVKTDHRRTVIGCHYSLGSVPFKEIDDYFGMSWKEYKFDNAFTAYVDHKLYECIEEKL